MDDQYNFFAEADPQLIFAYMDALALGEMPNTGENSRDPFFVAYNFQKEELARCKSVQEQLALSLEQARLENSACKDFLLARQAMRQSVKNSDLTATLARANSEFDWLSRKFHASISFGLFAENKANLEDFCRLFSTAAGLSEGADGSRLKNVIWLQYLAALNIDNMQEIFDAVTRLKRLSGNMPAVLDSWFALTDKLNAYFRQVTQFLDQFKNFVNTDLAKVLSQSKTFYSQVTQFLDQFNILPITGASKDPLQAHAYGGAERKKCMQMAAAILKDLRQRAEDMQAMYAFVMSSLANPALQITNELFAPKSGLAKLIANTRG